MSSSSRRRRNSPMTRNSPSTTMVANPDDDDGFGFSAVREMVTALDLEIPSTILDLIDGEDPPSNGRDRLRQKWAKKTVTRYAQAVQKFRTSSQELQSNRDEMMRCRADLFMMQFRRRYVLWNSTTDSDAAPPVIHSETMVERALVDLSDVQIATSRKRGEKSEGQETDTELETLSYDSQESYAEQREDGGGVQHDTACHEACFREDHFEDGISIQDDDNDNGFSPVFAQVAPFFHPVSGNPTISVANGKEAKRIKKVMIKALLNRPELQRMMHASPLLREMKELFMEETMTRTDTPLCTETKGCRCIVHKGAHEAAVETTVNSFINHFVGLEIAGGESPFSLQLATEKKKQQSTKWG